MAFMDMEQEGHGKAWRLSSYFSWGGGVALEMAATSKVTGL